MDNLKKRDYANFNNVNRSHRGYSPNGADYMNGSGGRGNYNMRNQRSSSHNNSNNKQVPIQYSNNSNMRNNKGNKISNAYESFSSTVQKKFNNVLYKGNESKQERKLNSKIDKSDVKNIEMIKREEEQPVAIPKSVFVFITIAVIFATGLVVMLAQPENNIANKVAENSEFVSRNTKRTDGDDGFETFAEDEDKTAEELEQLEQGENNLDSDTANSEESGQSTENSTNKTTVNKNDDKKADTTQTAPENKTTTNTNENDVTQTNIPRATLSPEAADEDSNEELANVAADVGSFTIPTTVSNTLFKTTSTYAKIGSDGKFFKYTNYVKESVGTTVPRNDLDGIWLFCKYSTLSKAGVTKVYGYRNGVKVNVYLITITKNGSSSTSYMYAMEGTTIDLSDGTYKLSGSSTTIKKLEVTGDKTLVEY